MALSADHRDCRLVYDVRGSGPPVLLIQGVATSGSGWRPQVEGLADQYQCLWFDNRGMGESQLVGLPLSVELMAEDARALMDAAGWESAHVVGHSLGGLVALRLALTCRTRVRSLSLLCTFASGRVAAPPTPGMIWLGLRTRLGTRRMRRRAFLRLVMSPEALAAANWDMLAGQLAPLFGHDLADQPAVTGKQLGAMRAYDATPHLGRLAGIPALVVSAVHDRIAPPRLGREIAAGIPGSRYVEIPAASHGAPIQCAHQVNALLLEHLAVAERGRTTGVTADRSV